jgi:hypothetical protein
MNRIAPRIAGGQNPKHTLRRSGRGSEGRSRAADYDFSKLEAVFAHIVESCVPMASASKMSGTGLELERRP